MPRQRLDASLRLTLLIFAITLLAGSLMVMSGWQTGNRTLIQIAPGFAPMQFNTALGFFGIGLCALGCVRRYWALVWIGAFTTILLGGMTLLEYLLQVNFGIDELFTTGYVMDRTKNAGRMSEPTAAGFLLVGLGYGLILLARGKSQFWRYPTLLCAGLAATITMASLLGYLTGFRSIGGWLNLYGMAVHTCVGFVLGSVGLMVAEGLILAPGKRVNALPARVLLLSVLVGGMSLSMYAAGIATSVEEQARDRQMQSELHEVAQRVERDLITSATLLDGAVGLFRASSYVDRTEWAQYVHALEQGTRRARFVAMGVLRRVLPGDLASYEQSVRREGFPGFHLSPVRPAEFYAPVHYIEPFDLIHRDLIGYDLAADPARAALLWQAAADGAVRMSAVHPAEHQIGDAQDFAVSLFRPLYQNGVQLRSEIERSRAVQGWAFLTLRPRQLMEQALGETGIKLLTSLQELGDQSLTLYGDTAFDADAVAWTVPVRFGGRDWRLLAHADPTVPQELQLVPILIFLSGSGLTAACCLLVLFLSYARYRARQIAMEMTESLRESERMLRQNEEHYTVALRGSRDGYWDWNVTQQKLFCSPGMRAMLGSDELQPETGLDEFLAVHCGAHEEARLRAALQGMLDSSADLLHLELEMCDAHGEQRWFLLRGRKVGSAGQEGVRLAGSLSNIHDRKLLELEMQQRNINLTNLNNELNQVTYVAAHNLREPVRKTVLHVSRLRTVVEASEDPSSQALSSLERIERSASRMADLVDDLMHYSEVVGGDLQLVTCNFDELFRPVLANLARRFDPADYDLKIDAIPPIRADSRMLRKAFEELISNAIRYRKPDEVVEIRVRYGGLRPHPGTGRMVHRIEVCDSGIGIEAQHIERVFNLFEQLQPGEQDGTGLGLAVVRKVIERHGAYMGLESEPGRGTTVWMEFQARDGDARFQPEP